MGISANEATSVKGTWKKVSGDLKTHGVKIFVDFLTANPDQQAFFKKFESVAIADLAKNDEVAKQAVDVMTALGKIIEVIDKPDGLKKVVKPLAVSHVARKVTLPNFQKMFPVIVSYIEKNAEGDKAAWTAAMEVFGSAIDEAQK